MKLTRHEVILAAHQPMCPAGGAPLKKHALIVGAADHRSDYRVDPWPSVDVMRGLLEVLGGWTIEIVEGLDAGRDQILAALRKLADTIEPDDTVLFYFFGHGGVVRFTDAAGELGLRPTFYLSAARRSSDTELAGVLDFELSAFLYEMDRICQNVTVMLDCCHSAAIVRGREIRVKSAPAWVHGLRSPALSSSGGHSQFVRLAATSALHFAFGRDTGTGRLGYLAEGLSTVIREAGFELDRLTWDAVMHRIREHAIRAKGYEEQWVTLAGPRNRLLFSRTEIALPRTVGFVAGRHTDHGWLRAGLLQGVNVGDEWGIAALALDSEKQPQILARMRVTEVDLNRARVQPVSPNDAIPLASGSSALLQRGAARFPVVLDGQMPGLRQAVEASPLLRLGTPEDPERLARVTIVGAPPTLQLRREVDGLMPNPLSDQAQALSVLEDWARSQLLVDVVAHGPSPSSRLPVNLRWSLCDTDRDLELPPRGAELREGQQIVFALAHAGLTPEPWYVCAIDLGVAGEPVLLNATEPDGLEIQPRQTLYLGRRYSREPSGIVLRWPELVPRDRPRPGRIIFLLSLRPLELGHMAQTSAWPSAYGDSNVGSPWRDSDLVSLPPAPSSDWAWVELTYRLQPAAVS